MNRLALLLGCGATVLAGACSGDPADVAGTYSVSVTYRENGCNLPDWTEDDTAANIPVEITQNGEQATATVTGVVGALVDLQLGSNEFTGEVDGDSMELTLFGERSQQEGNCTFTYNATLDATLDGDTLVGEVRYQAATNSNPDCADLQGCVSRQDLNGTRPPS